MILYNLTINIDNDIREEWMTWIQNEHIPKVMKTKAFSRYTMYKMLNEEENGGTTYCIQYFANTLWDIEDYEENYAPTFQFEQYEKFGDKFVVFRTVLESVD